MQELNERQPINTKAPTALLELTDPFLFKLWAIPRASQHIWNVSQLSDLTHEVLHHLCPAYFCVRSTLPMSCSRPETTSLQTFLFFIPSLHSSPWSILTSSERPTGPHSPKCGSLALLSFHQIAQLPGISLYIWYLLLSLSFCYSVNPNWARNCLTFSLVLVWNSFWHTVCDQQMFLERMQ